MSKQLSMPLEEYENELKSQFLSGVKFGTTKLVRIVEDIIQNDGSNIEVTEDADPALIAFIEKVKTHMGTKK